MPLPTLSTQTQYALDYIDQSDFFDRIVGRMLAGKIGSQHPGEWGFDPMGNTLIGSPPSWQVLPSPTGHVTCEVVGSTVTGWNYTAFDLHIVQCQHEFVLVGTATELNAEGDEGTTIRVIISL